MASPNNKSNHKTKKAAKEVELTRSFDLFPKSYAVFKRNTNTFIILLIIPFIPTLINMLRHPTRGNDASIGGILGMPSLTSNNFKGYIGVGLIALLVYAVISVAIQTMLHLLQLEGSQGKTPTLSHLWNKMRHYWLRMFGLSIVYGLGIFIGLLLLIVPGVIFIQRYFLAPYVLLDKDVSIKEAFRRSSEMSKPYFGAIWGIIGVTVLFELLGVVPLVGAIFAFVLTAFYSVAPALRYQELKKLS